MFKHIFFFLQRNILASSILSQTLYLQHRTSILHSNISPSICINNRAICLCISLASAATAFSRLLLGKTFGHSLPSEFPHRDFVLVLFCCTFSRNNPPIFFYFFFLVIAFIFFLVGNMFYDSILRSKLYNILLAIPTKLISLTRTVMTERLAQVRIQNVLAALFELSRSLKQSDGLASRRPNLALELVKYQEQATL